MKKKQRNSNKTGEFLTRNIEANLKYFRSFKKGTKLSFTFNSTAEIKWLGNYYLITN